MALELPADVRQTLAAWAAAVANDQGALRPVREESLHVTLCFLGSQQEASISAIADAVRPSATAAAPVLSLGAPMWLPPRRPRLLAVGLVEAGEEGALAQLQSALAETLTAAGCYEPEARPFLAHVTVARAPSGARLRRSGLAGPAAPPFSCRSVVLYRTQPGPGPARYEALAAVTLTGR